MPAALRQRFEFGDRIGSGAHGTVWRAVDRALRRAVAVKLAPVTSPGAARQAMREATIVARLNHPAIVTLFEAVADEHAVYLISELVDGIDFAEALELGRLSDRDVAAVGVVICGALAHAHTHGVVHRDIKPANIVLADAPGHGPVAKLTDFGVAKVLAVGGASDVETLAPGASLVGTLAYMAPEQLSGAEVGPPADVYALALTLYEGFTGANPVRAAGPGETLARIARGVPSLSSDRPDLPGELRAAIDRALAADPLDRPASDELAAMLAAACRELSDELPDRPRPTFVAATGALFSRLATAVVATVATLATAMSVEVPGTAMPALAVGLLVGAAPIAGTAAAAALVAALLSLPATGRPGLGVLTLAVCAPALAGAIIRRAFGGRPAWLWRAATGAAIFWWLAVAELARPDRSGLAGVFAGTVGEPAAVASEPLTALDGLIALAPGSGMFVPIGLAIWGGALLTMPLFLRGRALVEDLAGAAFWCAAVVGGHYALLQTVAPRADVRALILPLVAALAAATFALTRRTAEPPAIAAEYGPGA